jgi:hypothetical protein
MDGKRVDKVLVAPIAQVDILDDESSSEI